MEAAGSSSEVVGQEHEVFLSFRGADTRKKFTDHLYLALDKAGVRVFRDNEKLHVGEEIGPQLIQGIKESIISIPIFSKNYGDSKWCLKEFALMMECRKELNQAVLPIFYDVSPNEVQHQKEGSFRKAFAKHVKKYDAGTVKQWRDALSQVGSLKGWNLANTFDGHEGKLVEEVVAEVMKRLNKHDIFIKDNLVGVDDKINEVVRLLEVGVQDVRIIGIWGMGGIGKTTLANAIYNQISDKFECCGFLENVRENASQPHGLQLLQGILVGKLLKTERRDFATVSDGTKELRERCRGKKVLILLDDVDQKEQLEALLGGGIDSFGKRSRIIVTTRDSGILDGSSRDKIYELKGMETHHALQVFCNHAFQAESPTSELWELSKVIVEKTGGLPLALEVIGSLLATRHKGIWESTLQRLQRLPDKKVEAILRISYDALTSEQKCIFLDIACFYIGVDKRIASYIWEDHLGYSSACELEELCSKSLIKIQSGFTMWMHDQLRDLGRAIVEREFNKPGKRIWLWRSDESRDLLMKHKKGSRPSPNVEAICLDIAHTIEPEKYFFMDEQFRALPRLRFLQLYGADLGGNFQQLLTDLRWLSWTMCPFKQLDLSGSRILQLLMTNLRWLTGKMQLFECTLRNLNPKNLIVLNLSGSQIQDHLFNSFFQGAAKLKVLNLRDCKNLTRTPDFSSVFPELEMLILKGCIRLKVIHPSIGELRSLIYLNLEDCKSLKELPESIRELNNLEELCIAESYIESLVPIISVGSLKKLRVIDASGCIRLWGVIPTELERLSGLEVWKMSHTRIKSLPETISSLCQLQALDLRGCPWLVDLPCLPVSLISVDVTCRSMVPIPNLPDLINLEELSFYSCSKMVEIPQGITKVKKLQKLSIEGCDSLKSILGLPISLNELLIDGCKRLEEIQGIEEVVSLTILSVKFKNSVDGNSFCPGDFKRLPDLSKLNNKLHTIKVEYCYLLEIDQGFERLCCLRFLSIIKCEYLQTLPDLSNLVSLKLLNVSGCKKLQHLKGLDRLEALEILDIQGCIAIGQLPNLSNFKHLRNLNANGCEKLRGLEGLDELESLEKLYIGDCKAIWQLPNLSNFKHLRNLNANGCENLQGLEGLDGLEALEELNIGWCKAIGQLPNLSNLNCLHSLKACQCKKLQGLEGLDGLEALEVLNIKGCEAIKQLLPNLSNLKKLWNLNASGCEKVQGLEGLDGLKALEVLDISGCKAIGQLPNLSNLKHLRYLNVESCEKLQQIGRLEVEDIKALQRKLRI